MNYSLSWDLDLKRPAEESQVCWNHPDRFGPWLYKAEEDTESKGERNVSLKDSPQIQQDETETIRVGHHQLRAADAGGHKDPHPEKHWAPSRFHQITLIWIITFSDTCVFSGTRLKVQQRQGEAEGAKDRSEGGRSKEGAEREECAGEECEGRVGEVREGWKDGEREKGRRREKSNAFIFPLVPKPDSYSMKCFHRVNCSWNLSYIWETAPSSV